MASSIHISTLKKMLQSPDPVDIKLWTRSGDNVGTAASLFATTSTKALVA